MARPAADGADDLRGALGGSEGASAVAAWASASPIGLLAVGCLLCIVAAARFVCSYVFLQAAEALHERTSFKEGDLETTRAAKQSRWCVCQSDFDPVGRSGHRGVMLTDEFCDACYTAAEMVAYRSRLVRNGTNFSWILGILSVLLILLAFAPLLRRCCTSIHHKVYYLVGIVTFIDLCIHIVTISLWSNAEIFKLLCFQGHAFDPVRRTEVVFPDSTYGDVCAYSQREHNMSKSLLGLVFLDIVVFVTLAFMDSLREQGIINRVLRDRRNLLSSLISRTLPLHAFDTRHRDKDSMAPGSGNERRTFRSRLAANRGFRAAKAVLGVDSALGLDRRGRREPVDGLLSYRHDGRGRFLGRRGLINDTLPEVATQPMDIDMEFDDLSVNTDESDDNGYAARRLFEALPCVKDSTRTDDIDLDINVHSDSEDNDCTKERTLTDQARLDPVMLGQRRQLPKVPSALPGIPSKLPDRQAAPATAISSPPVDSGGDDGGDDFEEHETEEDDDFDDLFVATALTPKIPVALPPPPVS